MKLDWTYLEGLSLLFVSLKVDCTYKLMFALEFIEQPIFLKSLVKNLSTMLRSYKVVLFWQTMVEGEPTELSK